MDKIARYRDVIKQVLTEYANFGVQYRHAKHALKVGKKEGTTDCPNFTDKRNSKKTENLCNPFKL